MSFVTTGPDGTNYVTNMQRTVVVNQRRETTEEVSTFGGREGPTSLTISTRERSVTPDLVDEIRPFSLPQGMPAETREAVHSPTQSRRPIAPEDGESLTVRVRQVLFVRRYV